MPEKEKQDSPQIRTESLRLFLTSYIKRSLSVLKNPKKIIPTAALSLIWLILSLLQAHLRKLPLPLMPLNFLTYAQGGMYGGIIGAVGGIIGKTVVAAFLNTVIMPLFQKKNPFADVKSGFKTLTHNMAFDSAKAVMPLIGAAGAAVFLYNLFNTAQLGENAVVGFMAAIMLLRSVTSKSGFIVGLIISAANTFAKGKIPSQAVISKVLSGMTIGFTLAAALNTIGLHLCFIVGAGFIIATVVLYIITTKDKRLKAAVLCLFILSGMALEFSHNTFSVHADERYEGAKGNLYDMYGYKFNSATTPTFKADEVVPIEMKMLPFSDRDLTDVQQFSHITDSTEWFDGNIKDQTFVNLILAENNGPGCHIKYNKSDSGKIDTSNEIGEGSYSANADFKIENFTFFYKKEEKNDEYKIYFYLDIVGNSHAEAEFDYDYYAYEGGERGSRLAESKVDYHGEVKASCYSRLTRDYYEGRTTDNKDQYVVFDLAIPCKRVFKDTTLDRELSEHDDFIHLSFVADEVILGYMSDYQPMDGSLTLKERDILKKTLDDLINWITGKTGRPEEHTPEAESAVIDMISFITALLLADSGVMEGGGDDGDGEEIPPEDTPPDEEPYSFFSKDDPPELRDYIRENPDGTLSVYDAPTKTWRTHYPKIDPENGLVYENDSGTAYPPDFLKEHVISRAENAGVLRQDYLQGQQNLKEQKDRNAAIEADRQRRIAEADRLKAAEQQKAAQREKYEENLRKKYFWTNDTRGAIKKEAEFHERQAEIYNAKARLANVGVAVSQTALTAADTTIDVLAGATGGAGKGIQAAYVTIRNVAGRCAETAATGEGNYSKALKKAFNDSVVDNVQNLSGHFTGSTKVGLMTRTASNIGGEGVRSYVDARIDGKTHEQALAEGKKAAATTGVTKAVFDEGTRKLKSLNESRTLSQTRTANNNAMLQNYRESASVMEGKLKTISKQMSEKAIATNKAIDIGGAAGKNIAVTSEWHADTKGGGIAERGDKLK